MIKEIPHTKVFDVIEEVFGTDGDLYLRRWHGEEKTLDALVSYTVASLYDGLFDVDVYTYGDDYGFFAVNKQHSLLRSFGIKLQHRDKKELFWTSLREVLGDKFVAIIWDDNLRAKRFFEKEGGKIERKANDGVLYKFNFN